jgi:superfamily II DNA or RNA helicase
MTLTQVLAPDVDAKTRSRGTNYFHAGAVVAAGGGDWMAYAVVRGSGDYRVQIVREESRFTASCECPYFFDRSEICKHIWAALLEAERRGLLKGDGQLPAEAIIDPDEPPDLGSRPVSPAPAAQLARRTPPAKVVAPVWQQFLTEVKQDVSAAERAVPQPRFVNGQILYVVDVAQTLQGQGITIGLYFRQRKKNGEWAKPKAAGLTPLEAAHLVDPDDREILSMLFGAGSGWTHAVVPEYEPGYARLSRYYLIGALAERLLPMMAATGRMHLQPSAGDQLWLPIALDAGPPWQFELEIGSNGVDSGLRVDGAFVRDGNRMPVSEPTLILSLGFLFTRTSLARLDARGAFTWAARLRRAGPVVVPEEAASVLLEALARSGVDPSSLPEDLRYDVVEVEPRPRVRVSRPDRPNPYGARQDLKAIVQFDYDGAIVDADQATTTFDAARRRLVRRHRQTEQAAIDRLHQLGFRLNWSYFESRQTLGISPEQFPRVVHVLVAEGWRVEADGRAFRSAVSMQLSVSSGIDWFDLEGAVDFGDGHSAPFPQLLAAVRRGEHVIVLDDGSVGLLPEEWLRRYAPIASFGEADDERIRFTPSQAALLDALLAAQPAISVDAAFERVRRELQSFTGIEPQDPPRSFNGRLREYQRDALGWFEFLRRFGFGGCLADDMGLGKTVMVLALLDARRKAGRGPSLAVVPRSLIFNWQDEAARFAPSLKILDFTGPSRDGRTIPEVDLVLTTYGTMRQEAARLKDIEFDYVILDEAQAIKNASTASAKAARLLRASHRLALSGTPIENHLGELWSLFEFLNPGLLGSARAFQRSGNRTRGDEELAWLSRALRPFILRRTKEQVAPELPARSEQTIHCELEGLQRRHYDELREHYRQTLLARVAREGINRSKIQILEALLRLRQAACHSALIDAKRSHEPSAKFDLLLPRLQEVVDEGHKALVFSQFTSLLALLRPRIEAMGIPHEYLDGRTRDRAARVQRFQNDPSCPLFLISLKAGGLGLNLTAAEYVFLLDPWWNPAVEAQAIDRAHRIGQSRHVFAYRLIARDTVEEKVAELQTSKRALADAILQADAALIRSLDTEDLELLLS